MLRSAALLACVALAALSLPAAAAPTSKTGNAEPGHFVELDVQLAAGQRAPWSIGLQPSSSAPYDIHSHAAGSGQPTYHERGVVNGTAQGTFTAPHAGLFSWLVMNALSRTALTVTITVDPQPGAGGSGNPIPGEGLALAALCVAALLVMRPRRPLAALSPPPRAG